MLHDRASLSREGAGPGTYRLSIRERWPAANHDPGIAPVVPAWSCSRPTRERPKDPAARILLLPSSSSHHRLPSSSHRTSTSIVDTLFPRLYISLPFGPVSSCLPGALEHLLSLPRGRAPSLSPVLIDSPIVTAVSCLASPPRDTPARNQAADIPPRRCIISMASSTPATADTMVTLKVNFQGITRRAKMPLREMVPSVLDSQVRRSLLSSSAAPRKPCSQPLY